MFILRVRVDKDCKGEGIRRDEADPLSINVCSGAAETERAFRLSGTRVENITGTSHLFRVDGDINTSTSSGGAVATRAMDATTIMDEKKTVVYFPAIPSSMPLWGLLSQEDALPSSTRTIASTRDSTLTQSYTQSSGLTKATPLETQFVSTAAPVAPTSPTIAPAHDARAPECSVAGGFDEQSRVRLPSQLKGQQGRGGGVGGLGVVHLIQSVVDRSTRYRHAAVLHFLDAGDAAAFHAKYNGVLIPGGGVVKAVFLSRVDVCFLSPRGGSDGNRCDDRDAFGKETGGVAEEKDTSPLNDRHWDDAGISLHRSRSWSENSAGNIRTHAEVSATMEGEVEVKGSEATMPRSMSYGDGQKTGQGWGVGNMTNVHPLELDLAPLNPQSVAGPEPVADPGAEGKGLEVSGRGEVIEEGRSEENINRQWRPLCVSALGERVNDTGGGARPRSGSSADVLVGSEGGKEYRREEVQVESLGGSSRLLEKLWNSEGDKNRRDPVGRESMYPGLIQGWDKIDQGGGSGEGSGGHGGDANAILPLTEKSYTELPPCPVCLDRLDPSVSGIHPPHPLHSLPPALVVAAFGSTQERASQGSESKGEMENGCCTHRRCRRQKHIGSAGEDEEGSGRGAGLTCVGQTLGEGHGYSRRRKDPRGHGAWGGGREENRTSTWNRSEDSDGRWGAGGVDRYCSQNNLPHTWTGRSWRGGEGGGSGDGLQFGDDSRDLMNENIWKDSNCRVCRFLRKLNSKASGSDSGSTSQGASSLVEGQIEVPGQAVQQSLVSNSTSFSLCVTLPDQCVCETCAVAHNLWVCMVCGHVGCGRYIKEHANEHFRIFQHSYSLELSTGRIWDYKGDRFAHRAPEGRFHSTWSGTLPRCSLGRGGTGGIEEGHGQTRGGVGGTAAIGMERFSTSFQQSGTVTGAGEQSTLAGWAGSGLEEGDKVSVVTREYELLVARQLEEQQRYFEELIAKTVASEAEANAPPEEHLTVKEREETTALRLEVEELEQRYEMVLADLREEEETARRVRADNRVLIKSQRDQKDAVTRLKSEAVETKRVCQRQMADLDSQIQDLTFYLKAQEEVKSSPQREELERGSLVMGQKNDDSGSAWPRQGAANVDETDRERLSRRLKEKSQAKKRGGAGRL